MPARQKKAIRNTPNAQRKSAHLKERPIGQLRPLRFSPAGNSTRINAFVSSQGKRNQAKRDSR